MYVNKSLWVIRIILSLVSSTKSFRDWGLCIPSFRSCSYHCALIDKNLWCCSWNAYTYTVFKLFNLLISTQNSLYFLNSFSNFNYFYITFTTFTLRMLWRPFIKFDRFFFRYQRISVRLVFLRSFRNNKCLN